MSIITLDDLPAGSRLYVAGPMSLYKDTDWNFGSFRAASLLLRALGYVVVNPAEIDRAIWGFDGRTDRKLARGMTRKTVLPIDLGVLLPTCDAIYMLPGWSTSSGARAEWCAAETYGLKIVLAASAERGTIGFISEGSGEDDG